MNIVNFKTKNSTAENKILPYLDFIDVRQDYKLPKNHYEGYWSYSKVNYKGII